MENSGQNYLFSSSLLNIRQKYVTQKFLCLPLKSNQISNKTLIKNPVTYVIKTVHLWSLIR